MKKLFINKNRLSEKIVEDMGAIPTFKKPPSLLENFVEEVVPPGRQTPWGYMLYDNNKEETSAPKFFFRKTGSRLVLYQLIYSLITEVHMLELLEQQELLERLIDEADNLINVKIDRAIEISDSEIHGFKKQKISFEFVKKTLVCFFKKFSEIVKIVEQYALARPDEEVKDFAITTFLYTIAAEGISQVESSEAWNANVIESYLTVAKLFFDDFEIKFINAVVVKILVDKSYLVLGKILKDRPCMGRGEILKPTI